MASDSFVAFVLEQLSRVDALGCRAMFGGHGLYCGPTFFGILYDGRVYFKTDETTVGDYTRRGMQPFRPNDRQLLKNYYEVPADVVEDRSALTRWAKTAVRTAVPKSTPRRAHVVRE